MERRTAIVEYDKNARVDVVWRNAALDEVVPDGWELDADDVGPLPPGFGVPVEAGTVGVAAGETEEDAGPFSPPMRHDEPNDPLRTVSKSVLPPLPRPFAWPFPATRSMGVPAFTSTVQSHSTVPSSPSSSVVFL